MKKKSFLTGLLAGIIISSIFLFTYANAENLEILLNQFRVNVNGIDRLQWGENYQLENGETVPSSISYKDTTYLPIRKISELLYKDVLYNDETETISITDKLGYSSLQGTTEADLNGELWIYYLNSDINHKNYYLCIKDSKGKRERRYHLPNKDCIKYTDDSVYFLKCTGIDGQSNNSSVVLQKIDFKNDINSRDGISIGKPINTNAENARLLFDEHYVIGSFYVSFSTAAHSDFYVYDFENDKTSYCYIKAHVSNLKVIDNGDTFTFKYDNTNAPKEYQSSAIKFDKNSFSFIDNGSVFTQSIY